MSASALTYTLTANKGHREPRRKYIFILCAAAVVVLLLVDLCTDGLNELFYEARWPNMTSPVETEPDELRVRCKKSHDGGLPKRLRSSVDTNADKLRSCMMTK
jgi:hypothetical protein